jgi:mRNA interferase MazF
VKSGIVKRIPALILCSKYEVVVVPFPFTESPEKQKPRPVVILSNQNYAKETGNFLGLMVSSSGYHTVFDAEIQDLEAIGLVFESWMKPKIATFPISFIKKKLGTLSKRDQKRMDELVAAIT